MHTISDCMKQMGYQACKTDTDLWTKAVVRADDGNQCYAYFLIWCQLLLDYHDIMEVLQEMEVYFQMNLS